MLYKRNNLHPLSLFTLLALTALVLLAALHLNTLISTGLLNFSYVQLDHKRTQPAGQVLQMATRWASDTAALQFGLGQWYKQIGNRGKALQAFVRAGEQRYHPDLAFFWAGEMAWRLGAHQEGVKLWMESARYNEGLAPWVLASFSWTKDQGWVQKVIGLQKYVAVEALAARLARTSIEAGHRYVWLYHIVGSYYESLGLLDEAIAWYKRGDKEAQSGPLWVPATDLGRVHMALGEYATARRWWWRAIERCPGARPDYVLQVARTYEKEGQLEEALFYYKRALSMSHGSKEYRQHLERFLRRVGAEE